MTKFYIGAEEWNGLSKLIEECGEVMQVAGKLIATDGKTAHWDGKQNLDSRLEEELGDLMGAINFFLRKNNLDLDRINARSMYKVGLFEKWSKQQTVKQL